MATLGRVALAITLLAVLAACGSGAPGPTAGNTLAATLSPSSAGNPSTADGLCGGLPSGTELAVAALGGAIDAPTGGDVLPRPNGVYCHFVLSGDASTNVEAQLKDATRAEFESLADTMGADIPLTGLGEAAFRRDSSSFGGGGVTVVAFGDGKLATVILNREGTEQALMNTAVEAIAQAVLAANP